MKLGMRRCGAGWRRAWMGAVLWLAACIAAPANAQNVPRTLTPSTKIGTAPLVDPAAVRTSYGAAVSVDSVVGARAPEVTLLAEGLRRGRDDEAFAREAFNFVHNNIDIAWTFGLQKGALGAIIDRSGTAFDQAKLLVEILRAGQLTSATYEYGALTLNKDQFAAWSGGVTKATAACQLLSSGGIPAKINGTVNASCGYAAADVSEVVLAHVWVKVTIAGNEYKLDPAYKTHDIKAADATLASKVPAGGATAAAVATMASGASGGASYVQGLSGQGLSAALTTYATDVQCLVGGNVAGQCPAPSAHAADDIDDIVGGARIHRDYPETLAGAVSALPREAYPTWVGAGNPAGDIPDTFRTKLTVKAERCPPNTGGCSLDQNRVVLFDRPLFVDDIYGRKLTIISRDQPQLLGGADAGKDVLRVVDEFGGFKTVGSYASPYGSADWPTYNDANITLTVDHPYPTGAGAPSAAGYMDTQVTKNVFMWMPITIVHSWGDVDKALSEKWGSRDDTEAPWYDVAATGCEDEGSNSQCTPYAPSSGDGRREQLAAAWLVQSSQAARLHAALADAKYTHHHSVGLVSAVSRVSAVYLDKTNPNSGRIGWSARDSFDRIDVDTAFSLTSRTNDAVRRRAGVHAIAETLEILEGSVAAQIGDLPDTTSVAVRFAWGNAALGDEQTPFDAGSPVGSRKFWAFDPALGAAQPDVTLFEGALTSTGDGENYAQEEPDISPFEASDWRSKLIGAIRDYAAAGYRVVASEESFLGPGQRAGAYHKGSSTIYTHDPSLQRGGALVATKYDPSSGDPLEIAHVAVGLEARAKGGGGGAGSAHQAQYDPSKAADALKARFVDRSSAVGVDLLSGKVTYSSPAGLTIGQGEFPDKLSAEIFWRGGEVKGMFAPAGHTEPQTPWSTNWHNMLSVSSSAAEAMGQTDVRAAGATIAAFMAMQDVYRAAPSAQRDTAAELVGAWWADTLVHNVVTVNVGAGAQQFFRRFDKVWFAPGPGRYAELTQTGEAVPFTDKCGGGPNFVTTRGWNYAGVGFSVRNAGGDVQQFPYWGKRVKDAGFCSKMHGFRMTSWTFPKGVTINLTYTNIVDQLDYLTDVTNSLGRQIHFDYNGGWVSKISDCCPPASAGGCPGARVEGVTPGCRAIQIQDSSDGRIVHTDADGKTTKFTITRYGGFGNGGYGGHHELVKVQAADQPEGLPAVEYVYDSLARVNLAKDRLAAQGPTVRQPHQFLIGYGLHGERIDPEGHRYAVDYDEDKHPIRFVDELGRIVTATYDGRGRTTGYTYPEADREAMAYDDRNNETKITKHAKPGSPEASQPLVIEATWEPLWNKLESIKDARRFTTSFTYFPPGPGGGEMESATRPTVEGGGTPVFHFTYNAFGQLLDTTDPTGVVTRNAYDPATHYLVSTTLDPNGINAATTFVNNAYGDPLDIDGPRPASEALDISHITYDVLRRKVLEISPDTGNGRPTAKQTLYDAVGRAKQIDAGHMEAGQFKSDIRTDIAFDAVGNKVMETTPAGVTQFSYDGLNRLICTAKRMGATDPDACKRASTGNTSPDQISANVYDEAGQLKETKIGVNRDAGNVITGVSFVRYEYTLNGQRAAVLDGVNNRTSLIYDGFDRLVTQFFPQKVPRGANAYEATDREDYRYDPNGNRTRLYKRDKTEIDFDYDALNRMSKKTVIGSPGLTTTYSYDLADRLQYSAYTGLAVAYTRDSAGRVTAETTNGRVVGLDLDKAGNRIRLTWPGGVKAVEYEYDAANRLSRIREPGATSGVGVLATFQYDDLGRRKKLTRGNGGEATYDYDPAGRLWKLGQVGAGTTPKPMLQTIAYSPASQITQLTQTNSDYAWTGRTPFANETYNGQNQISRFATVKGYDDNGNLTATDVRTYRYDAENRLTEAKTGVGAGATTALTLTYDPTGRLLSTVAPSAAPTYFLYAGDELIGEYPSADINAPALRRYVHANDTDDPIVWYDETRAQKPRFWLHPDRQGSIVATSDEDGAVTTYSYGPWGETGDWSSLRFRYTGQAALPEIQAYHYKARVYDPNLGRFMQTDPIGQKDDPNLYAYVRDDPTNALDPSGMDRVYADVTGSRNKAYVDVDAKLTDRQSKAIGRDFALFIGAHHGQKLASGPQVTAEKGVSGDRVNMVRATSQFVGTALRESGGRWAQNWNKITEISLFRDGSKLAASGLGEGANGPAIIFTGTMPKGVSNFYSSPSDLARVMMHETNHVDQNAGIFQWMGVHEFFVDMPARVRLGASGLGAGCTGSSLDQKC